MFTSKKKATALEVSLAAELNAAKETISRQRAVMEKLHVGYSNRANPWRRAQVSTTVHPVRWPVTSLKLSFLLPPVSKPAAPVKTQEKPVAVTPQVKPVVIPPPVRDLSPMDTIAKRMFGAVFDDLTSKQQKGVRRAMANGQAH